MIVDHIHQALAQVRQLRARVLEGQRFRGWSGRARGLTGILAFLSSLAIWRFPISQTHHVHLYAWMFVLGAALLITGTALTYWFMHDPDVERDWHKLRPIVDLAAPLLAGAVLTYLFAGMGRWDWLFGLWMCNYGLANLALRRALPPMVFYVGVFYLLCGLSLLVVGSDFLNPLPMGIVFGLGELAGGWILHVDSRRSVE